MASVRRGLGGSAVVRLGEHERLLLRQLLLELQARIGSRPGGSSHPGHPGHPEADPRPPNPNPNPDPDHDHDHDDLEEMLAGIASEPVDGPGPSLPEDPVLARLVPDAYAPDLESGRAASEFRRFTEADLLARKLEQARVLLDCLAEERGKVVVPADRIETWLYALNDLRLALGTDLGVDEEGGHPDPDDADFPRYVAYAWLTQVQSELVEVAGR